MSDGIYKKQTRDYLILIERLHLEKAALSFAVNLHKEYLAGGKFPVSWDTFQNYDQQLLKSIAQCERVIQQLEEELNRAKTDE